MALTAKGKPLTTAQESIAQNLISVGQGLNAPTVAVQACIAAAIFESDLGQDLGWNSSNPTYGGVLAENISFFGRLGPAGSSNVTNPQARRFYPGRNGYTTR